LAFVALGVDASEMMGTAQTGMIGAVPGNAVRDSIRGRPSAAGDLRALLVGTPSLF